MNHTATGAAPIKVPHPQIGFSRADGGSLLENAKLPESRRFVQYKQVEEIEIESDFYPSHSFSKQTSNKSGSNEHSKALKSPANSTKDNKRVKLTINPSIKKPESIPAFESQPQELTQPLVGDKPMKPESPKQLKRTPTNKHPVKVFAGKDSIMVEPGEIHWKKPPISKNSRFTFGGLTIDVEEANKQVAGGSQPLQISKRELSNQGTRHPIVQRLPEENKDTISFLQKFYQDQIDRLSSKNENLLRENERLKIELQQANQQALEVNALRIQISELQERLESQTVAMKETIPTSFLGELRNNPKVKIVSERKTADILRHDRIFCSADASGRELSNYQPPPLANNGKKVDSGKCRKQR